MNTWTKRSLYLAACIGAVVIWSCGSDDPSAPPEDTTPQPGHVYNWAGTGGAGYGAMSQPPAQTKLYWPVDVVFSPTGTPYVLDWNNHRVIRTNSAGEFELVVGVADGDFGDPCPTAPAPCTGIVATNAKLNHPTHVAFDPNNGDMVLCAWHNSMLFRINLTTGLMDRFCGNGARSYNGDNQPAAQAFVDLPVGLAFDPQGLLVFGDQANMIVRRIDANGIITTIAGTAPVLVNGVLQYQAGFAGNEGPATAAKLSFDRGQVADPGGKIAYDANGNLYIADTVNHSVRVVDTNGIIHQFAGVGTTAGFSGDGLPATSALLRQPRDVAVDSDGNVFIADTGNHVIRMVATDGTISTVAGQVRAPNALPLAPDDVRAESGKFAAEIHLTAPIGVEVDSRGRVWISDTENNVIRILYR
jgi:streptogramin lyase